MSLEDKLQIILITYNRSKHVKNTLERLLEPDSPANHLNILVLDNNSTDSTAQVVQSFMHQHTNVSYHKNKYNLGIAGNIARAMELANQEYVWILGDDDNLHWEGWPDLEQAIQAQKEIIVAANYVAYAHDISSLMFQMGLISACIFKTSIFTDTTLSSAYNNVYTLFPHLVPVVECINAGNQENIYLLPHPLVSNGRQPETDCSYIRGYNDSKLYLKQRSMSWIVGYANILLGLNNKKLRYKMMSLAIHHPAVEICGLLHFYYTMDLLYIRERNYLPVIETMQAIYPLWRILGWLYFLSPIKIYRLPIKTGAIYVCVFNRFKFKIWPAKNK